MIIFLSGAIMTEKNVEEAIKDGAMEEYLNVFSDGIQKGDIYKQPRNAKREKHYQHTIPPNMGAKSNFDNCI